MSVPVSAMPGGRGSAIIGVMGDGLGAAEWEQFTVLLRRFAEHDLDQHEAWRLETRYGPVYVRMGRELRADEPAGAFSPVRTPPGDGADRTAHAECACGPSGDPRSAGRRLLGAGPVTLYFRMEVLDRAVASLRDAGYHVVQADASRWLTVRDMRGDLSRIMGFPGYYGENLDALSDCLRDVIGHEYGFPAGAAGLVLVLTGFHEFAGEFPEAAHGMLDVIAERSRGALLAGEQLICLVQSGDPRLTLPPVGAIPPWWNEAEWFDASRGL